MSEPDPVHDEPADVRPVDVGSAGADGGSGAADPGPEHGWQPLPLRARTSFVLGNLVGFGITAVGLLVPIGFLVPSKPLAIALSVTGLLVLPSFGIWQARKQYAYTWWRLDDDGFALRRGRLWQTETRVPATRVQHLDLKRGPIERRLGLSTLVIHTAGTRHSAVAVGGLDAGDAERLRDHLARQRDEEDDDHADA
jgi:membrane protein YdbS with pleckstrin-like domain